MHHIAIMRKSWGLIPKILSGEKTIESRWYQTKRLPWNRVRKGDTIFFKNSGQKVSAKVRVLKVLQFKISSLGDISPILKKYANEICLVNPNPREWSKLPKYCILMKLANPKEIKPFEISKRGFSAPTAWLTVSDISKIKKYAPK